MSAFRGFPAQIPKRQGNPLYGGYVRTASEYLLPALPLIAFLGFFLGRVRKDGPQDGDWREAFLYASVAWAAMTFAITELLSLGRALDSIHLALCWGLTIIVLLFLLRRNGSARRTAEIRSAVKANDIPQGLKPGVLPGDYGTLRQAQGKLEVVPFQDSSQGLKARVRGLFSGTLRQALSKIYKEQPQIPRLRPPMRPALGMTPDFHPTEGSTRTEGEIEAVLFQDRGGAIRRGQSRGCAASRGERVLLIWIAVSLAVTAVVAFVAPPNNWDSMTYHMARVAHWWADKTVAFYPTNIQRQLYSSPLAEYAILQFFVLGGGSDRLANLVQWFSFGGCAIAMSLVARRLGADRITQWLAAFVVLATPMCILEATSTQNDVACAFLTATMLYFLYRGETLFTGLSLGLAILVKSTAGLAVAPFLLLIVLREPFSRRGLSRAAAKLIAIGGIAFAVNAPHWMRNLHTFGDPLGYKPEVKAIGSQTLAPGPFVVNLMRHTSLELVTPFPRVSKLEEGTIRGVCKVLGLDADDKRNTFQGMRFSVGTMLADEDFGGDPLQFALLIAATVFLLASRRLRRSEAAKFAILVWVGFLLIAWRLSWQPWMARIHSPFLVLSGLPIAIFLGEIRGRFRLMAGGIVAALALMSLLPLLYNHSRPLVPLRQSETIFTNARVDQYFVRRPGERACYVKAAEILSASPCRIAELKLSGEGWEYPLWALTGWRGAPVYFEHIDVDNQTRGAKGGFQGARCETVIIHDEDSATGASWIEIDRLGADGEKNAGEFQCQP